MSLLNVESPTLKRSRAHLLLRLEELVQLALRDGPLDLEVYGRVRGLKNVESMKRSLFRLQKDLRSAGAFLDAHRNMEDGGWRIHFEEPSVVKLVTEEADEARRVLGYDVEALSPTPATIRTMYRDTLGSFGLIKRRTGIGAGRLRKMLVAAHVLRAPHCLQRIEELRSPRVVQLALETADTGATLEVVASVLGCSVATAGAFLKRQGRSRVNGRPRKREA